MPSAVNKPALFPSLSPEYVLAFQFSSWYPKFSGISIKSTVIRPLSQEFQEYLDSDGVFLPDGAEDVPVVSELSDNEDSDEEESEPDRRHFAFPELDAKIREAVVQYGAVFPKLNFSSPRDAAWMLPASSPLKCMSPADVYLFLKSSDFIQHDITSSHVFEGCEGLSPLGENTSPFPQYELELILRKWYPVDRSREIRCFVRQERLLGANGVSQRDPNYYDFWIEPGTQAKVLEAVQTFWKAKIKGRWEDSNGDYVFDFLLTRDLSRGHILDFNPYAPRTDPLLFTYEELHELLLRGESTTTEPELRVVDSLDHPVATRNAPAHQHNMVPLEALTMSSGRDVQEFANLLQEEIQNAM
ncbi:uncharacterized protein FIBRA_01275 [Fibroporia radiculosa]|uniref:Uncharacterized protein n=1 Tax=Fibroporia radiculosa TaxID=599839 RepID=J4GJR3_9APHY|nr:uncharacterized protein FIBRA_01275 [Fibroporia radiculosa]CCL99260.1 predicted protein [Fibroporia radiculosa]